MLSFEYKFEYDNDEVSFATLPPYTFSDLHYFFKNKLLMDANYDTTIPCLKFSVLCKSLSGIVVPLLTITEFETT